MLQIDGSRHSGSGTIVRQSVAFSALTGQAIHVVNARVKRPNAGLRPQHVQVINAIRELVEGTVEGVTVGSREFVFRPGPLAVKPEYDWDIGSAGSTLMLTLAVLPVLAFGAAATRVRVRGGMFQDFAPSFYHVQHVVLPLLERMGLTAALSLERPGYVPRGDGVLHLTVTSVTHGLHAVVLEGPATVRRVWGLALASHLEQRRVGDRMAKTASRILEAAGYAPDIEIVRDTSAGQPGAALALFADLTGEVRLGADQAGALGRTAEAIGRTVARQLLREIASGATVDRCTADQLIPFAALAAGETRVRIPEVTDHVRTNAWLAELFLGARVSIEKQVMTISGRPVHRS
jgi:RNA 3'-terminal phosphate cyclase (ATP)